MRPAVAWLLKAAVTGALLAWLFSNAEIRRGLGVLTQAEPGWLVLGGMAAGLAQVFSAWRWQVCLRTAGVMLPALTVLRITLAGTAAGFLSVGVLGTDVVRAALAVRRCPQQRAPLVASIGMDHACGFPVLVVVGLAVLTMAGGKVTTGQGVWIGAGLGLVIFLIVGLVLRRWWPDLHRRLRDSLRQARTWRGIAGAVVLSVPAVLCHYGVFYGTARALGVVVPPAEFFGATAVADTVAALPVSLAGLGVREKAFETILGHWHGVPAAQAVALSLAGLGLILLWGLAGAVCWLAEPVRKRTP